MGFLMLLLAYLFGAGITGGALWKILDNDDLIVPVVLGALLWPVVAVVAPPVLFGLWIAGLPARIGAWRTNRRTSKETQNNA